MIETIAWTEWKALANSPRFNPTTLAELLDGGQAFRWKLQVEGTWVGVWDEYVVELKLRNEQIYWRAPKILSDPQRVVGALDHYLVCDPSYAASYDALPWRSDRHLAHCLEVFPELRILRQPFGETLLCFLCSATKQIVQIKQMVALLAERHGRQIVPGFHRLPSWPEIAGVTEEALRHCLLGFRARYIYQTARFLAERPSWLKETEMLPYAAAKERLCSLPGVGEKVADCVLLFGAGRLEAFPVDVWIIKTMEKRYGLDGWRPPQIAHFGRVHFGAGAGLAQQFLFAWERREARLRRA